MRAAGAPWEDRGKYADEMIRALKSIWTTDPVEFQGTYHRVAKSVDGWLPVGIPLSAIGPLFEEIRQMARNAGRDPFTLALIVRANVEIHDAPVEKDRVDFAGSLEQIGEDIEATRKLGAAELILDAQFSSGVRRARTSWRGWKICGGSRTERDRPVTAAVRPQPRASASR